MLEIATTVMKIDNPMNKIQLIDCRVNRENCYKIDFTFTQKGKPDLVVSLKEKSDWPMVLGQPLDLVEKWFIKNYGDLLWLFGFR